jgi:hypothetical protein
MGPGCVFQCILAKIDIYANNSTISEARENIDINLQFLEIYSFSAFFDKKVLNGQILLNKFLVNMKLFRG